MRHHVAHEAHPDLLARLEAERERIHRRAQQEARARLVERSEALLDVPPEVTVHTSNPAVDLLHALYFHLT